MVEYNNDKLHKIKIHVSELKKNFGHVKVLQGISTDIYEGEVVCIIGPSGSGKSTFLRCLNRLESITSGEVVVDGYHIDDKKININKVRENIGMVFQHFNLFANMNVLRNLMLAPVDLKKVTKEEAQNEAMRLLEMVGLTDKAESFPSQLSGGQKQRVAIARALAGDPKVLLCDEATSALDPKTTTQILALLKKLNQELKLTIVIITHQMSVVKDICDRAAVMEQGEVIEQGSVYDLFSNPKTKLTKSFMETANNFGAFFDILNEKGSLADVEDGTHIYLLTYTGEAAGKALMSEIYKKFTVESNILYGNIDYIKGKPLGKLAVNLTGDKDKIEEAVEYIKNSGVQLEVLK